MIGLAADYDYSWFRNFKYRERWLAVSEEVFWWFGQLEVWLDDGLVEVVGRVEVLEDAEEDITLPRKQIDISIGVDSWDREFIFLNFLILVLKFQPSMHPRMSPVFLQRINNSGFHKWQNLLVIVFLLALSIYVRQAQMYGLLWHPQRSVLFHQSVL